MAENIITYHDQVLEEVNKTPAEHLPHLLQIIRIFRESISLKPADESLAQGWTEAMNGETRPVSELWDGIESD